MVILGAVTGRESEPDERERRKAEFMRLVNEVRPLLSRLALRLADGNVAVAEDCVQDAVVSAYKAYMAGAFKHDGRFREWIVRILTNCCFVSHRKSKRTLQVADISSVVEARQQTSEIARPIDDEVGGELLAALEALSEDQRDCVLLVDLEQMDYSEAAKTLGIPIGTVRSRINRARLNMARHILAARARRNGR